MGMRRRVRQVLQALLWEEPQRNQYTGWHDRELMTMGRWSYGHPEVIAYGGEDGHVNIGPFVSIGAATRFLVGGNHRLDLITTSPLNEPGAPWPEGHNGTRGDITIGPDVWIGRGATILSGVTIGAGAVVAACSVVTRDVEPYWLVAGNPARPKHRRLPDLDCERLLALAWWDWPDEHIRAARRLLHSEDVQALCEYGERIGAQPRVESIDVADVTGEGGPDDCVTGLRER